MEKEFIVLINNWAGYPAFQAICMTDKDATIDKMDIEEARDFIKKGKVFRPECEFKIVKFVE